MTDVAVEDVQAETRTGQGGKWNTSFSPVQVGKQHLYKLLAQMGLNLYLFAGWETKELRNQYGLKKTGQKSKAVFSAHAVDAWVLAANVLGLTALPDTNLWYVTEIRLHRRQLHKLQPAKGGVRKREGGTRSRGLKRGTLVRHPRYGLCSVGGTRLGRVSLHAYRTNKRLTQTACAEDLAVLTSTPYRTIFIPIPKKTGVSSLRINTGTSAPGEIR